MRRRRRRRRRRKSAHEVVCPTTLIRMGESEDMVVSKDDARPRLQLRGFFDQRSIHISPAGLKWVDHYNT